MLHDQIARIGTVKGLGLVAIQVSKQATKNFKSKSSVTSLISFIERVTVLVGKQKMCLIFHSN